MWDFLQFYILSTIQKCGKSHPSSRAAVISGPQVTDAPFVISGVRSIQSGCPDRQNDGWTRRNTGYWRLVHFWREKIMKEWTQKPIWKTFIKCSRLHNQSSPCLCSLILSLISMFIFLESGTQFLLFYHSLIAKVKWTARPKNRQTRLIT